MDDKLNRCVEDACLNAWPALKEIFYDGWLIRLAEGHTRRTNSVNVLHAGVLPIAEKVAHCERLYAAHGLPPIFRLRSTDDPALEQALASQGYSAADESCTLYKDFAGGIAAPAGEVDLLEGAPSAEWLGARARIDQRPLQHDDIRVRLLRQVALPVAFAAGRDGDGRIVSVAYGALHAGLVSLQWVVTDPEARGSGHARANLLALMQWAAQRGAQGACLQVFAGNAPAIGLYESMGFAQELYRYHYRVR